MWIDPVQLVTLINGLASAHRACTTALLWTQRLHLVLPLAPIRSEREIVRRPHAIRQALPESIPTRLFFDHWRRLRAPPPNAPHSSPSIGACTVVERCFALLKRYCGLKHFKVHCLDSVWRHALLVHAAMSAVALIPHCCGSRPDKLPSSSTGLRHQLRCVTLSQTLSHVANEREVDGSRHSPQKVICGDALLRRKREKQPARWHFPTYHFCSR